MEEWDAVNISRLECFVQSVQISGEHDSFISRKEKENLSGITLSPQPSLMRSRAPCNGSYFYRSMNGMPKEGGNVDNVWSTVFLRALAISQKLNNCKSTSSDVREVKSMFQLYH